MATVSRISESAIARDFPDVSPARHAALLRWHGNTPLRDLAAAQQAQPGFPLIACSTQPRTFAPVRGTPRPAA